MNNSKRLINSWTNKKAIFIKRVDSQQGKDVFKINNFLDFKDLTLDEDAEYIIEEEIKQTELFNKINRECVLSLRVITLNYGGDIKILGAFLRVGFGNNKVDNTTSGGIFVRYDFFENKLDKVGYRRWRFGGKTYFKHPNTGFIFENKPLPYPEKVMELVDNVAKAVSDKDLIGWDIAYSDKGPLLIEGNDNPALIGQQINYRGFLNNPWFKNLYKEYFNTDGVLKSKKE